MSSETSQTVKGNNNTLVAIGEFNTRVGSISSILAAALGRIASIIDVEDGSGNDTVSFEIDEKLAHNNVVTFRGFIEEYGQYGSKVDELYEEYDNNDPGFKRKVFRYFKTKYALEKQSLCTANSSTSPIEVVRAHADTIMRSIFDQFTNDLKSANNLNLNCEEVEVCALVVTCHAFIQCKILEKPSK